MNYKFYRGPTGRNYVEDFVDALSDKQAAKAAWAFDLIENHERTNLARTRYFKKLEGTDDIWEIRVGFGGDIFRFLGFFDNDVFIINHGFVKKEQKTKRREIEIAESRKSEYLARNRIRKVSHNS